MKIKAPISGIVVELQNLSDPVFAQRMVGDGYAIDPVEGVLRAPATGKVIQIHPSHHAITLELENKVQILMHIGIDTVQFRGQGFNPKVKVGQCVQVGDILIEFALDQLAQKARSLVTPILVTEPVGAKLEFYPLKFAKSPSDVLFEIQLTPQNKHVASQDTVSVLKDQPTLKTKTFVVQDPTGLHARPAALISGVARQFSSQIEIVKDKEKANAKSLVGIMGLQVAGGDIFQFTAYGPDAQEAVETLTKKVIEFLSYNPTNVNKKQETTIPAPIRRIDEFTFSGVNASPGLAVGQILQVQNEKFTVQEFGGTAEEEKEKLFNALSIAKNQLEELKAKVEVQSDFGKAAIFAAHQDLLTDPDILQRVEENILQGKSAAYSWKSSIDSHSSRLASLKNELLAARANDLNDIGDRVLRVLLDKPQKALESYPSTILVAENLTPSDTASLDPNRILGICTVEGGPTSHVAILARSLNIPALAGIHKDALHIKNGTEALLDTVKGRLRLNPSQEEIAAVQKQQELIHKKNQMDLAESHKPAITKDGYHIEVAANIGGITDALETVRLGGEGVGLLRSEFLFLEREEAPSEDEQLQIYQEIVNVLGPDRPLTIRTLDVGGDKPLKYLTLPAEENPFLGIRGLRLGLKHQELLRAQLRAILRVQRQGELRVMFPMVGQLEELRMAKAILEEERQNLGAAHLSVGIMIEVPSAAVMAGQFAQEVDFFSIGTNDLAQYTLAMDRGHAELAQKIDGLHPSILRLIKMTVDGAHKYGKWVGVCGGIASDIEAVPVLIGLGVEELSVSLPSIPAVKSRIRELKKSDGIQLWQNCLNAENAKAIRDLTLKMTLNTKPQNPTDIIKHQELH